MKKIVLASLSLALAVTACKKKEETPPPSGGGTPTPTVTCKPVKVIEKDSTGTPTDSTYYTLNSSNKVIKRVFSWGYDTIIYTSGGLLSEMREYQNGNSTVQKTYTYTYSGSNLTTISESGTNGGNPYTMVTTFTYNSSNKITSAVTTGSPNGSNESFLNIVYSGNNPTSLTYDMDGTGANLWELTLTFDDKKNATRFDIPERVNSVFEVFAGGNLKTVTTVNAEDMNGTPVPAGSILVTRSFTYTSENEVNVATAGASLFETGGNTSTYSWSCN